MIRPVEAHKIECDGCGSTIEPLTAATPGRPAVSGSVYQIDVAGAYRDSGSTRIRVHIVREVCGAGQHAVLDMCDDCIRNMERVR